MLISRILLGSEFKADAAYDITSGSLPKIWTAVIPDFGGIYRSFGVFLSP